MDKQRNIVVRQMMFQFKDRHFGAQNKIIAMRMKMNITYFNDWIKGNKDVSDEKLYYIEKFIKNN